MSAVASRPSTPGPRQRGHQSLEQLVRMAIAVGLPGGTQGAAGRMVAGDDHQLAVRRRTARVGGGPRAAA